MKAAIIVISFLIINFVYLAFLSAEKQYVCEHYYIKKVVRTHILTKPYKYKYSVNFDVSQLKNQIKGMQGITSCVFTSPYDFEIKVCNACDQNIHKQIDIMLNKQYQKRYCK